MSSRPSSISAFQSIELTAHAGWAEIAFNRPEVLNALDRRMVSEIGTALDELAGATEVCALIFRGCGRAFMAGADVAELRQRNHLDALSGINSTLFQRIQDYPWPTVAAIDGFALGGGCELALACDIRVGTSRAVLGQPEVGFGIIPAAGSPQRLTQLVGTGRARELIFTGRRVHAQEALTMGLLNRVVDVDALLPTARELVQQMLANSPLAIRLAKVALNSSVGTVDRRGAAIESLAQAVLFDADDKHDRMTQFLERQRR